MRRVVLAIGMTLTSVAAQAAMNRVYLVRALTECPGPASCQPSTFESGYTFDTIVLKTPASKFGVPNKPALAVEFRGVRTPSGAAFTGTLSVRVKSGRVSIPGFGTLPDDSPLAQVAPLAVTITNGRGKVVYTPPASPSGLITNGGGVEVVDPDGKMLAVTGTQTKP